MKKEEKENKPLITTIIPTYQRPKLLKRAILSVLNQTYSNFQVCIYDNASGDETAEVVKELSQKDPRVHYYCHSYNTGGFNNLDFGLRQIDTSYFSILSDDDILLPDFYEETLSGFKKYPEAGFVVTQTITATEKEIKRISCEGYEEKLYNPPEGLIKMSDCGTPTWTGILFRRKIIKEIGLLDEKIGGPSDTDFLLRSAAVFPFVILKSPGAIFLIHKLSSCSAWSEVEPLNGYIKILKKIKYNKKIPDSIRLMVYQNIKKRTANILWHGGLKDVKRKNFSQAKQLAKYLKDDFNKNIKAMILYNVAKFCEMSNLFYSMFFNLNRTRRFFQPNRNKLQKTYKTYLKYLQEDFPL